MISTVGLLCRCVQYLSTVIASISMDDANYKSIVFEKHFRGRKDGRPFSCDRLIGNVFQCELSLSKLFYSRLQHLVLLLLGV